MNLKPNNNHHNGKHYHATQEGAPSSRQKKGDMYHFFFNQEGIVHHKYTLWGQNVKKSFLFGSTKITLIQSDINNKKKKKKRESGAWKIYHYQTLAQSAQCVQQSLATHHIPQVGQLLYSPDTVHRELFLLLQINNALRGNSFEDTVTIKHNGTQQHLNIPRIEYDRWKRRWNKHIHAKVEYFKVD